MTTNIFSINNSLTLCGWRVVGPPSREVNPKVASRKETCRDAIRKKKFPITRTAHHFTYSERKDSIPIGAFILILIKLQCPNGYTYYELWLEFVRKGERLQILSFFTIGLFFKDPTEGNAMFNEVIPDIIQILSGLRFEPDVFLGIARKIVPRWYEVTMHLDQEPFIEDDFMRQFQLFNPFSIRPDYFGLPERPVKRARILQFVAEDLQAVEVVNEENPFKKRRI